MNKHALWFDIYALVDGSVLQQRVDEYKLLSSISLVVTEAGSWRMHYSCQDADLRLHGRIAFAKARWNFARQVRTALQRLLVRWVISEGYRVNVVFYQTRGEIPFVIKIEAVTTS